MKFTKYILALSAALGLAACVKEEMVKLPAAEDVVAPVLEQISDAVEITPTNMVTDSVVFQWSAADYGVATEINYSIEAKAGDLQVTIMSGIIDTDPVIKHTVKYELLNQILFNDLKLADGIAEDVTFMIGSKVGNYEKVYSNEIKVSCKVTAAEKEYAKLFVVGSYNGWSHDKNQYIFDFAGDDAVYQGLVDFGADHAANEFKITGGAWGKDEHSMDGAHDAEAKSIKVTDGGGDNINVYQAKRYYHLTYDRAAHTLKADVSFDQIGVIGDFNGWGADVVMNFNEAKQKFYADVEFPADGGFKFRLDADWSVSYGSKTEGFLDAGDNIPVKAGNYRVYLNMNNFGEMTYALDAKMFGKDEPAGSVTPPVDDPEPTPTASGWALIGDFNGWGADLAMKQSGAIWSVMDVELKAGEGWKLRKDAGWDVNRGAAGDVEPFEVPVGEGFAAVAGGKNLTVPADGKYDVYYDEGNETIYVLTAGSDAPSFPLTWYLVGGFNGWTVGDAAYMMKKDGDFYVYKNFVLETANEVKFNAGSWDVNRGAASFSANAAIDAVDGGGNINVAAGTYDVYLSAEADKIYFMTDGKTPDEAGEAEVVVVDYSNCQMELVGSGVAEQEGSKADTAWSWGNVLLASNEGKPAKEGDVYTWTWNNVTLTADGWKIRTLNAAASGDVASFDLGDGAVDKTASPNVQESGDGNIYVTAGTYNITLVIDSAASTKTVTIVAAE